MCRQRKVNTDIVSRNKRASPCISKACLCGCVFSSGGSLGISLTLLCVCVCVCVCQCTHVHPCMLHICVRKVWVSGEGGGVQVRLCGHFATEGTVYRARIQTALSVVLLNVSGQIFFQPSAVSTQLTFLTKFIVFKHFFFFKGKHIYISLMALFN